MQKSLTNLYLGHYIPDIRKEYRFVNMGLIFVMSLLIVLFFVSHSTKLSSAFPFLNRLTPSCFVKEQTGVPCPTCGMSRSIVAFYQGDFLKSRNYHPYGYFFVLFFCLQFCLRAIPFLVVRSWLPWVDTGQMILGSFILIALTRL